MWSWILIRLAIGLTEGSALMAIGVSSVIPRHYGQHVLPPHSTLTPWTTPLPTPNSITPFHYAGRAGSTHTTEVLSCWTCCTHMWQYLDPVFVPETRRWILQLLSQGLFVSCICIGSGDPVRVLRLLHNEYSRYKWCIYCWDIYTTCRYQIYVLLYWYLRAHWRAGLSCPDASASGSCEWLTLYCTVQWLK